MDDIPIEAMATQCLSVGPSEMRGMLEFLEKKSMPPFYILKLVQEEAKLWVIAGPNI